MPHTAYVANPTVREQNEVILYADDSSPVVPYRWKIKGPVRVTLATQWPEKLVIGELSAADNPILSLFEVSDLRSGMGIHRYVDIQGQRDRYYSAQSIDALYPSAITLGPVGGLTGTGQFPAVATFGAVTNSPGVIGVLNGRVNVTFGAQVFTFTTGDVWAGNGAGNAPVDTLPAVAVGNMLTFRGTNATDQLFVPLGAASATGYSYQTTVDQTAAWTDVAAGAAAPAAICFVEHDNLIWALDTAFRLWSSPSGLAATWTGYASVPVEIQVDVPRGHLAVYDDANGDPTLWAITHQGPYLYDRVNNKWFRSRFQYPYARIAASINSAVTFGPDLWTQLGDMDMAKLSMNQSLIVDQRAGPVQPDGASKSFNYSNAGTIINIVADDLFLYALLNMNLGTGANFNNGILMYNGRGWHLIHRDAADIATSQIAQGLALVSNINGRRLWFNEYDATQARFVYNYINLVPLRDSPFHRGTSEIYSSQASLMLPWFDAGVSSQAKTAIQMRVRVSGLVSANQITISYRLNGDTASGTAVVGGVLSTSINSTTGLVIGDLTSGSGEAILRFGNNGIGLEFNSIAFHVLITGTERATTAPRIEYMALEYYKNPDVLKGFAVTLDMTEPYNDRTPAQQVSDLWDIVASNTLGTFAYRDDASSITVPGAPAVAVGGAGNVNAGAHYYAATFLTADGETGLGTTSAVVVPGVASIINVTAIPTSTNPTVYARRLYRTVAGGGATSDKFLVTTINDNSTTTYNDNTADAGLGALGPVNPTWTSRAYLVKVMRPEGMEHTGPVEGGEYTVFLHMVSNNDGSVI